MRTVLGAQTIKIRVVVLALMVAASIAVVAAPTAAAAPRVAAPTAVAAVASSVPYNCSYGIRYLSQYSAYYAWAICRSGSGYYRVGFGCQWSTGETYWVWGPTMSVGQGESRGQCHAYVKPVVVTVQTWS
jgi:hypothetical protein